MKDEKAHNAGLAEGGNDTTVVQTPQLTDAAHTPGPYYVTHGIIFTKGDPYGHGQMRIADMRGWGHLTGRGACAFDEDRAAAIQDATAEFIVRACNSHDELLEALRRLRNECEAITALAANEIKDIAGYTNFKCFRNRVDEASAVIAKAEGRP